MPFGGTHCAVERAIWLANVAETLAQAQRLVARLERARPRCRDTRNLPLRIEALRNEVETLQRTAGFAPRADEQRPLWTMIER